MDLGGSATDEILETIDTPIVILNYEGEIVRFNSACERLTGFTAAEALGRKVWDFLILDEEIPAVREVFNKTRATRHPSRYVNYWKTKTGGRRLIEWSNTMLRNTRGEAVYVLASGVDITEARARETALNDSQAFLRSIIDASPVAVITADEQGRILNFSKKAEQCFGYLERDVIGRNVSMLMPDPDRSSHDGYLRRYLTTGEAKLIGNSRVVNAVRRNNEEFPAYLHVTEFQDERRLFVGFIEDISEQKATETRLAETRQQLHHAGRVGAMGEMATSIAHELNQPLTAAASLAEAVKLTLEGADCRGLHRDVIKELREAVGEIQRASEIIRQMRDFVRKRKSDKRPHEVNKVVEEACAIALIGAESQGIKVATNFGANVGEAFIDRIQIQQVMTNLIRNAIDAMQESREKQLTISTSKSNGQIEVRVEDTGIGIPDDVRRRLFEPFVTSKREGTGIGLAISKSIIDAHQGEITGEANDTVGSVFVLRVPAGAHGERDEIG